MSVFTKRAMSIIAAALMALGLIVSTASPAAATAQTCISARGGYMCTLVTGSGTYVESVSSSRGMADPTQWICNYSAWFFYVPPTGGAYGLGYQSRAGCTPFRAYFTQNVNRSFPKNTLVCSKFMEDYGTVVGEKCVGVS